MFGKRFLNKQLYQKKQDSLLVPSQAPLAVSVKPLGNGGCGLLYTSICVIDGQIPAIKREIRTTERSQHIFYRLVLVFQALRGLIQEDTLKSASHVALSFSVHVNLHLILPEEIKYRLFSVWSLVIQTTVINIQNVYNGRQNT